MDEKNKLIAIRCTSEVDEMFRMKAFLRKESHGDFLEELLKIYLEHEIDGKSKEVR